MSDVLILGAGPIGLATSMLLARDGHRVTVLERDPQPPPASGLAAWERWDRAGVAQFRQIHALHARFRMEVEAEFPDVLEEIEASGARHLNFVDTMPLTVEDRSSRIGDERFGVISARRPIVESAFARVAEDTPGVKILRGIVVTGLIAGRQTNGTPHVTGAVTSEGERFVADLIVDAMGRRSSFPEWVTMIGARPPHEEISDTGFAYYTRHYRYASGSAPGLAGPPPVLLSSAMAIGLPMDNDTSCVGVICMAGDQPLKELRRNDVFERVVRSIPRLAHWLEGDPLHDVRPMAGAMDRYRRFVIDGEPVVAGLLAVGDAWACTNPTAGRGLPLGIAHAVALRDVAGQGLDDPYGLAVAFDAVTEGKFTPWYRNQIDRDHERVALMKAAIEGREPPKPDESNPMVQMQRKFMVAANFDPDVARAFLDVMSVQHLPHEVIARPGIIDKVIAASDGRRMPEEQGPSREELLALVS